MDERSIFLEALQRDDQRSRDAWLNEVCGKETPLRTRVDALLCQYQQDDSFLEKPPEGLDITMASDPLSPQNGGHGLGSVLAKLDRSIGGIPRVALRSSAKDGGDPIVRPRSAEVPGHDPDSRYQLLGEIARGGMGAIIKGRDTDLGRDLAVKVLLDSHKGKPEYIQRFVEEAQIGGQLQHPGIAPVYELGQFGDARPYFSMKLIKGTTLAALLAEREDSSTDHSRLLGIFEQVCQTMAYAHSRGVIHRDLKPSNVMVGAFGEVQVMDWGLAKVLTEGGIADEKKSQAKQTDLSIIHTIRSLGSDTPAGFGTGSAGSQTQMGSVMGTPAYMPPEQALGEIDRLDERSDVFGLGAILCEILTGKPPYCGTDATDVFRQASRGKLDDCFERLDESGTDEEPSTIVRHCLALEPDDRPRNAGVLAERLKRYLESVDERLRQAELDRLEATTKAAEERKRRKVILALAASVVMALSIAGGGWMWVMQKNAAIAQAATDAKTKLERQISSHLSSARTLRNANDDELPQPESVQRALAAVNSAQKLIDDAGDLTVDLPFKEDAIALRTELQELRRDQKLIAALENAWQWEMEQLAEREATASMVPAAQSSPKLANAGGRPVKSDELSNDDLSQAPIEIPTVMQAAPLYEKAFAEWGVVPTKTSIAEAAQRIRSLPESLQASVIVSMQRWREVLKGVRTSEQWENAEWTVAEVIDFSTGNAGDSELLPDNSVLLSRQAARGTCELILGTDLPKITAVRLEALPHESIVRGGPGWGMEFGGFDARQIQFARVHRDGSRTPIAFRSAVARYGREQNPVTIDRWRAVFGNGKRQESFFETSRVLRSSTGFKLAFSMTGNLGHFRISISGDQPHRESFQWLAKVIAKADDDPWRNAMNREIARADVEALLRRANDVDELDQQPAIVRMRLAETLRRVRPSALMTRNDWTEWDVPSPTQLQASGDSSLELKPDGSVFVAGDVSDSETYTLTLPVGERPINAIRLETLPHESLPESGSGRGPKGRFRLNEFEVAVRSDDGSEKEYAVEIQHVFAGYARATAPISLAVDQDHATSWSVYPRQYEPHWAVFLFPTLKSAPGRASIQVRLTTRDHVLSHFRLSVSENVERAFQPRVAALSLLKRMHEQNAGDYWGNLALAETFNSQTPPDLQGALRHAIAAIALRPNNAMAHAALVRLVPLRELDADDPLRQLAFEHSRKARELDPGNEAIHSIARTFMGSGWHHFIAERHEEAIRDYQTALGLEPNYGRVRNCMAHALSALGKRDEAIAQYRRVIATYPSTTAHAGVVRILREQQKYDEAVKAARKFIQLKPKSASSHSALGDVLHDQGKLDQASDAYDRAIELDPFHYEGHANRGLVMEEQRKFEEAIAEFHTVLKFKPGDIWTQQRLSETLFAAGRLDEAIEMQRKMMERAPKNPSSINSLAWNLVTLSDPTFHKPDEAVELATRAVDLSPETATYWNTLGVANYRAGNWQACLEALQQSIDLTKETESTVTCYDCFFMAMAHWQLNQQDEAREYFDQAVKRMDETAPENAELIRFRAEAEALLEIDTQTDPQKTPEEARTD